MDYSCCFIMTTMRVTGQKILSDAIIKHADARAPLESWLDYVKRAEWNTPADLQRAFSNVTILPKHRVVFKIKGNHYRLIVRIDYQRNYIDIRFFDTHAEYDKIDALNI